MTCKSNGNKNHDLCFLARTVLPITALFFLMLTATHTSAQPNFSLVGFATENGGTKGGQGGQTVTATSYSKLASYAESSTPYTILVGGTISNGSAGGKINVKSNKSIIGIGSTAFLSGIVFSISSQNNIIIQNLKITLIGVSNPKSLNDGDCIGISGSSKNIWIDHCEIYSEDPDVQTNIDKYDGLIDIKNQTGYITISWNYLHDHHKGGLVGSSDGDLFANRKITMHHNYYNKVLLRIPMYRGATGHFFNNYIVGAKDATEIRAGTCLRVEKNYYEALHYSIYTPNDAPGKSERIDNIEVSRTSRAYPVDCVASIPYNYSSVLTNNTSDVKTIVPQYAGVGKISTVATRNEPVSVKQQSISFFNNKRDGTLTVQTSALEQLQVSIFSPDGKQLISKHCAVTSGTSEAIPLSGFRHGMYIIKCKSGGLVQTTRMPLEGKH